MGAEVPVLGRGHIRYIVKMHYFYQNLRDDENIFYTGSKGNCEIQWAIFLIKPHDGDYQRYQDHQNLNLILSSLID